MRFLHTGDWHIGKTLRGRSRADEQQAVLGEMLEIVERERVGFVVVAGDVFDSQAPSAEAERMVFSFFAGLVGRKIPAVVIAGNHDHPKRLAALRPLLETLLIHVFDKPGTLDLVVGEETARIVVVPWDNRATEEPVIEGFTAQTVNVVVAHAMVSGGVMSGSERYMNPFVLPLDCVPEKAHYVALGHLHRPQEVGGRTLMRYAGSPIQMDFGEEGQEKSVVVVEAAAGRAAKAQEIRLWSGRRLRSIRGTFEEVARDPEGYGDDFLRVTVRTEGPAPGLAGQVRELLVNAVDIQLDYEVKTPAAEEEVSLKSLTPEELFARYFAAAYGSAPAEGLVGMFRKLYGEAQSASE